MGDEEGCLLVSECSTTIGEIDANLFLFLVVLIFLF